ncbi:MAG: restriction endonuclease [Candidatus Altimarinota bacterium]
MNNKWIISRHTRDMNLLIRVAELIKKYQNTINDEDKDFILKELELNQVYSPRFGDSKKSTLTSKINQLAFYMFGYKTKLNNDIKFLFSPLSNLLFKYKDDEKKRDKVFLTMLWGLQFNHPHSQTDIEYELYPLRLIFNLLKEPLLDNKLYVSEIAYLIMQQKNIDKDSYYILVNEILKFRKYDLKTIEQIFLKDKTNILVNAVYETDYYLRYILSYFNLIIVNEGNVIATLSQGKNTTRKLKNTYYSLNNEYLPFMNKLENLYSFLDKPLSFKNFQHKLDVVKEIYNFYPNILLEELGEDVDCNILQLPELINKYSANDDNANAYNFEDVLEQGFNTFKNVDAKKIAGAGNTDIKCLYLDEEKIFAVEAKSTKNKLNLVNDGRLGEHRLKIGAEYTIVITPRYVPAVLKDIKNTKNVIITASTFSEYLYNSIIKDERNIDYKEINDIIINNLGTDISDKISDLTINKFATLGNDISL